MGSVYSNFNTGWRGAQNENKCWKQKTRQDEAQCTRTSRLAGEELKKRKTSGRNEKSNVLTTKATPQYLWISSETRKELISDRTITTIFF